MFLKQMQQQIVIRKANLLDAKACAMIHKQEIATGFLSQLGVRFLELLYTAMVLSQHALCLVAEDEEKHIVGFISGCYDVRKFYKEFFIKHGLRAFLIILPQIIRLSILRKIFETIKYPANEVNGNDLPEAELLSIAVNTHLRGLGISEKLANALFDEFRKRGIQSLKVVVGTENTRANGFYKKVGFKLHSNISVHKSEISNVYVKML